MNSEVLHQFKKFVVLIFVLFIFACIYVEVETISYIRIHIDVFRERQRLPNLDEPPKVLVWTNYFSSDLVTVLSAPRCTFPCQFFKRENISEWDAQAVVFHFRDLDPNSIPLHRHPDQIYISFLMESPANIANKHGMNMDISPTFFNATLDYRRKNGTYFRGYSLMKKAETKTDEKHLSRLGEREWNDIISNKSSVALAMISNCRTSSGREYYLEELSKHIRITFVGACFNNHSTYLCSRASKSSCEAELIKTHYFVFAFENSVCTDYVTEKFWRLRRNIVPIVLRRSILKGIAPDSAFIAADDFSSPLELANHLSKVSKDPKLYKRYFSWRDSNFFAPSDVGVCDFCRISDLSFGNVSTRSDLNIFEYYSSSECEKNAAGRIIKNIF